MRFILGKKELNKDNADIYTTILRYVEYQEEKNIVSLRDFNKA